MLRLKKQAYSRASCQPQGSTSGLQAFTMVEVIVALAILSTSMLAVFGVLRMCLTANSSSQMLTKSVLLAESLLSETMLKRSIVYQTTQGSEGPFGWQIQIAPTEMDNLAAICVLINWQQQQRQGQFELFSLVHIQPQFEGK